MLPAAGTDLDELLRLRGEAEDWLAARGIDQWRKGEVPAALVAEQLASREWHVVRSGERLVGALRLLWSDPQIWLHEDRPAAYVHGLVIDRRHAGHGLGARMLTWAEGQALSAGHNRLRLDCAEGNPALRRYYAGLGFREVGRRDFDGLWFSAVLLEKPLRSA